MLSRAGSGPGGKCVTPFRHRLCRVRGPSAGRSWKLLAVAPRQLPLRRRAHPGRTRRWIWLFLRPPTQHLRRGALRRYPGHSAGLDGTKTADRLCCQPKREGAWVRRQAHRPQPYCQAPGAVWRLPSPRIHLHAAGPTPRTEGPSHGRPK